MRQSSDLINAVEPALRHWAIGRKLDRGSRIDTGS